MIHDSIAMSKVKSWYGMLSPLAQIEFIKWLWDTDAHKVDYANMSEPLQRFHNPTYKRETK